MVSAINRKTPPPPATPSGEEGCRVAPWADPLFLHSLRGGTGTSAEWGSGGIDVDDGDDGVVRIAAPTGWQFSYPRHPSTDSTLAEAWGTDSLKAQADPAADSD